MPRLCFYVGEGVTRRTICVDIPLIEVPFEPNQPDPPPEASSWIHGDDIKAQTSRDLRVLATIHSLAASLSAEHKGSVQGLVGQLAEKLPLPEGLTATFGRG